MAPTHSLARLRKHVLDRVARGEVTMVEAARQLGCSRSRLYELKGRYERYGEAGLFPKPRPAGTHPARVSPALRDQIVAYAVEHPTEGPRSIAWQLTKRRFGGWRVSPSTVYNVLVDAGLNRRAMRLAAAEALAAAEGGPVTERALRDLRAAQAVEHRHLGSDAVGETVFLDTMYVGNLKGVGKVWQYTGVDGACSFGFARARAGKKNAAAMADFLEHDIAPTYREAGIPLVEVVTDGGPEFTGRAFGRACARLGIRWHKLPPAHRTSTRSSNASRAACCTCTTAPRSATATTPPPRTSTKTCKPGCATTTSNARTAATAPAGASRPPSSTPLDPTCSPRKDGTLMTSTRSLNRPGRS